MILMTVIDDQGGLSFNQRRQSRDRKLTERLVAIAGEKGIWLDAYSAGLFEDGAKLHVDEDFLESAGPGDYCFVEDKAVLPYEDRIEAIILFRWNRAYPADMYLDISLDTWKLEKSREFKGYSHEKITEEVYTK